MLAKHIHRNRAASLTGLAAIVALALSAAPTAATVVCPPGVSPPSLYCTNVHPTARTGSTSALGATAARLNGVAGPGVQNGDSTKYFFEYGRSKAFGSTTREGTVPAGPASAPVSAVVSGLRPGTRYHFRVIATNSDGTTFGLGKTFTTMSIIQFVTAPSRVKHRSRFRVSVGLRTKATVTIALLFDGKVAHTFREGARGPASRLRSRLAGRTTSPFTLTAPGKTGKYALAVTAKADGVTQKASANITVF